MTSFERAAIILGVGLGGFFDGIVLHQILQWHHMLSVPVPPDTLHALQLNTLADGLFHAATWALTVLGVVLLVRSGPQRAQRNAPSLLVAGLLVGWGLFNVADGIVNHFLLGIHHVRQGNDPLVYDVAFLVWGAAMLAAGVVLARGARGRDGSSVGFDDPGELR